MQQSDTGSSDYQFYQPHLQNPNPNLKPNAPDPQFNYVASAAPSAPPVTLNYAASDYSNYSPSSVYHSYNPDHGPTGYATTYNPTSQQPYSFPHLDFSYYPDDQSQTAALDYEFSCPNPSYNSSLSYSAASHGGSTVSVPSYDNSFGNRAGYVGYGDQGLYDAGVYKYNGTKVESFSGNGGQTDSANGVMFNDYESPIPSGKEQNGSPSIPKIVKASPKIEEQQDAKGSIHKFRVKLLSEGVGQTDMDVLCQIGLDGIHILDPATSRTLKIYPLDIVTRWEVLDLYIFAFWTKSSIGVEARRIRLKSNSYTTSNILDTVTAASIQVKEMGGTNKPSESIKGAEQSVEKKKGIIDWMNMIKPGNEEKDHWVPDEAVTKCTSCAAAFNAFVRKHHCRNCGDIFCDKCTQGRVSLTAEEDAPPVRVCDRCMAEVTERLSNTKEAASRLTGVQSHEELVRKLKEEMDKNCRTSTGHNSDGSSKQMREVACPICTVHLQVEVAASGSETIECSVCQHPFRVGAH